MRPCRASHLSTFEEDLITLPLELPGVSSILGFENVQMRSSNGHGDNRVGPEFYFISTLGFINSCNRHLMKPHRAPKKSNNENPAFSLS